MADDTTKQDDYYDIDEVATGRTKEAARKLAELKAERDAAKAKLMELEDELKKQEQEAKKRKQRTRKLIQIGAALMAKTKENWEDFDFEQWWIMKEKEMQDTIEAALENAASETEKAIENAVSKAREDAIIVRNEAERKAVAYIKDRATTLNYTEDEIAYALFTASVTAALYTAVTRKEKPTESMLEVMLRAT